MKIKRLAPLTLLELVISLAIVVALASVLLDNFADAEFRERERQTHARGSQIQHLITGQTNANGISLFLSDLGRFPKVHIENDANGDLNRSRFLAQLYDPSVWYYQSESLTQFSRTVDLTITEDLLALTETVPFTNYIFPKVNFTVGWRGPYLMLPTHTNTFNDGWGRPWEVVTSFWRKSENNKLVENYEIEETPTQDDEIEGIVSWGADGTEGGINPCDMDAAFLFPYEDQLATLTLNLKIRDELDPSKWNDLTNLASTLYQSANTYTRGAVVHITTESGNHYYTSLITDNNNTPYLNASDYTITHASWQYGVPANCASIDATRILLFSPAMRGANENATFEGGFYRFSPYEETETNNELLYPALYSCRESANGTQSILIDPDANLDDNPEEKNINRENKTRLHAILNWEVANQKIPSYVRIERLIPGSRFIYAFVGYKENANYFSKNVTDLIRIELKPGENHITLYLERKP